MWNERTELEALQEIYDLTDGAAGRNNWRKVLAFGETLEQQLKRKLLWIWPTALDLKMFNQLLVELKIHNVLSIGCGSGLLEWLLLAAARADHLSIYGLEWDANWWRSKYAVRSFIELNYIAGSSKLNERFLSDCCAGVAPCALLFCYFNNRAAFVEYLSSYKGSWLILIGPQTDLHIHTDPSPLEPQLPHNQWALRKLLHWTENNIVAFYERLA